MQWEQESSIALRTLDASLDLLQAGQESMKVDTKGSYRDIVTEWDLQIETLITSLLRETPYPIIGEESFDKSGSALGMEPTWLVDPIDGTVNFVHGIPLHGISIGLMAQREFKVGAVAFPALKEIYFTHGSAGAFVNGRRLSQVTSDFHQSLLGAAFSGQKNGSLEKDKEYRLFGKLNDNTRGCLRLGSAAVLICYVASGKLQCAYGIGARIWDVAGAMAIALQTGYTSYIRMYEDPSRLDFIVGSAAIVAKVKQEFESVGLKVM